MNKKLGNTQDSTFDKICTCWHLCHRQYHKFNTTSLYHGLGNLVTILNECDGMSQKVLLDKLKIRASSLHELIERGIKMKVLTKTRDQVDKRKTIIKITDYGRSLIAEKGEQVSALDEFILAPLTLDEQVQFAQFLDRIIDNLEGK